MKRAPIALWLILFGAAAAAGQAAGPPGPGMPSDALRIALATEDYPVTPGDAYTLTWWQADTPETASLVVSSSCSIDMGIFGSVDADGITATRLKSIVRDRVSAMYARGFPSLTLAAPGEFRVKVSGEVAATAWVPAWGLSRLSEVVAAAALPSASLRDVQVLDSRGGSSRYDLFQAARQGTQSQDPLVHPGESVVLGRAATVVRIAGEVRRPGVYQLLPGDTLGSLVNMYSGGPAPGADTAHVAVDGAAGTRVLDLAENDASAASLADGDSVRVPALLQTLPLIYVEGAVAGAPGSPGTNRLALRLRDGETLRDVVLQAWDSLSPLADLGAASLVRGDGSGTTRVDLRATLTGRDPANEPSLRPFDRIVIPAVPQAEVGAAPPAGSAPAALAAPVASAAPAASAASGPQASGPQWLSTLSSVLLTLAATVVALAVLTTHAGNH
jgi:polysaccharide biosynthesis/export protein